MALEPGGQQLVEVNRHTSIAVLVLLGALALDGCGQKGALYLPGEAREIVTRPTQAPADEPAPPPPASAPNSPGTVDSPVGPASPAPEVVAPGSKDQEKKDAPKP
jgi:predicted small lipoprotein YifL